jgi:hypothetical protein
VSDFRRWRRIFDSHAPAHRAAGLLLRGLWREERAPREIYFLFEVRDARKATAFLSTPHAAEAAAASGVMDGEYHFIRASSMGRYR